MTTKRKPIAVSVVEDLRPILVKVGKQYVNPKDISAIKYVKSNKLYVVNFISAPEPQYAFWVEPDAIGDLVAHFNVKGADNEADD